MFSFHFTVEVTYTDRTRLLNGRYQTFTSIVEVMAEDDREARLVAVQLVTAIRCDLDVMVLGERVTDCVDR